MRLTLRNLLNYLDGVLPADEAQEIGKKIQESEFASSLCLRIRDCLRRLRLAAPSINERGSGLDPNTVAEYLDHALSEARVQDFERVCLESDVHLAEVASCHQVLTAILGGPADTDPASVERMCQIPAMLAAGEIAAHEPAGDDGIEPPPIVAPIFAPPIEGDAAAPRQQTWTPAGRVPTARHEGRRPAASPTWLRRLWQGLALAVVVAAIVVIATLQYRPNSPLAKLFSRGAAGDGISADDNSETSPQANAAPTPATRPSTGDGVDGALQSPPRGDGELAPARIIPLDDGPAAKGSAKGETSPKAPAAKNPPADDPAQSKPPKVEPLPPEPPDDADDGIPAAPRSDPQVAAQFHGPGQVTLRIEPRDGQGYRMDDQRLLRPGDRVIALPGFRPEFMLPGRLRVTMVGGGAMTLLPAGAGGFSGVETTRARLLARPETPAGAGLYLRAQDVAGLLTLAEETTAALEVARAENPGVDPETQPGQLVVDLYVLSGKATWRAAGEPKPRELKSPVRLALSDRPGRLVALQQRPRWAEDASLDPLEQRAAAALDRALALDKPVGLKLHELARRPQKEVHWLAQQCLAWTGNFESLVEALGAVEQKSAWSDLIAELKAAVAAGPESAAAVRTALEKSYGAAGADMYPLLWKYGPEPPGKEGLAELIGMLDNPDLAVRVLAFWNLRTLTGQNYGYRPEDNAQRRQPAILRWRERGGVKASAKALAKSIGNAAGKAKPGDFDEPPAPRKSPAKPKSPPSPPDARPPEDADF